MSGWVIPPPKTPTKSAARYASERRRKVRWLEAEGLLKSEDIKAALLRVPRAARPDARPALTGGGRGIGLRSCRGARGGRRQDLTLFTKQPDGVRRETICRVLYVALRGAYGGDQRCVGGSHESPCPQPLVPSPLVAV